MNYIGVDISLNSTALFISKDNENFIKCYLTEDKETKWTKILKKIKNVEINFITHNRNIDYSDNEIIKLEQFDLVSSQIINDLMIFCKSDFYEIRIEGYSFSKNTNSILDIVAYSTLIKTKIINNLNCKVKIIAPSTLKKNTCSLVYGINKNKTYNPDGIAGGSFTKFEIYKTILDGKIETPIYDFLYDNSEQLLNMKKLPSPIDDINDATMASKIIINK